MHFRLIVASQDKKNWNQDILHFENATYRVLHERSNITAPSAEHLKFLKKMTFAEVFWVNHGKKKKEKEKIK